MKARKLYNPMTGYPIQMGGGTHKKLLEMGISPVRIKNQKGGFGLASGSMKMAHLADTTKKERRKKNEKKKKEAEAKRRRSAESRVHRTVITTTTAGRAGRRR